MNRAERRRRGLTRSRMARTGTLASAGVLMTVGLFGAYTGSPRLQRAYASGCTIANSYLATTDDSLNAAINNSAVTCIEIQGTITLPPATSLDVIDAAKWVGSPRELAGLTILGDPTNGTDKIEGDQTNPGAAIRMYIDGSQGLATQDIELNISDVTFTDLHSSGNGGALFAVLAGQTQPVDLNVNLTNVTFIGNKALQGQGGAVYLGTFGGPNAAYLDVGQSEFHYNTTSDNSAGGYTDGGAIYVWSENSAASAHVSASRFTNNSATSNTPTRKSRGGAIAVASTLGGTAVVVDGNSVFTDNHAIGDLSMGGAIYSDAGIDITSAVIAGNTAAKGGGLFTNGTQLTITDSTIRDNDALDWGGGVYADGGAVALYRSAIVANDAANGSPGGILVNGGPLTLENSFVGENSANYDPGAGIWTDGDVHLRSSTVYGNINPDAASEIHARNLTSTMSVVGNSTTSDIWVLTGALEDTSSVSTSDDTQFGINLMHGTLDLGSLTGSDPGQLGRTPSADSPLALGLGTPNGLAPLFNPLPGIATDQWGFARVAPFTIGARQALTINSVTPSAGDSTGGQLVTIHGSAFTGATSAAIGGSALTNLTVVDDTTITGTSPAGTVGDADVTVTDTSGTATLTNGFEFIAPSPNPPAPIPATPASPPQDVRAIPGIESATVSWTPPASTGTFPVTSYQAVATPGGQTCMVAAPELTCTITGLTAGTSYTVTTRALTGAGWSAESSPGATVVPLATPQESTILITSSRDRAQKSMARIEGTTTGLVGAQVVPYIRVAGKTSFTPGASTRTVDADGKFTWQRKAKKRFTVYFTSGDVTSNRLVIRPE